MAQLLSRSNQENLDPNSSNPFLNFEAPWSKTMNPRSNPLNPTPLPYSDDMAAPHLEPWLKPGVLDDKVALLNLRRLRPFC
ncbi:hypothetical protein AMTR_s00003p00270690 [Amborella trichopoda]|uniref:Uncharacterized protein n=1 Tax=Amborella trichopoda TaxID=13333 RepID=W1P757_AMBTC|nr:hypothetical protein AMTR_s00003p00270690 [Amborella trichopoda]